jgi:uncharacterized protein (DUF2141 family)
MKQMMMAVLLLTTGAHAGELRLELQGKGLAGNQIRFAVYPVDTQDQFPSDEKFYRSTVIEAMADRLTATVPDLPPGKYAVAAYVDNN